MWNLNGTIKTPWFGENYAEDYYKEDRDFHVVLELPKNIQDLVGSSSLIIVGPIGYRPIPGISLLLGQ